MKAVQQQSSAWEGTQWAVEKKCAGFTDKKVEAGFNFSHRLASRCIDKTHYMQARVAGGLHRNVNTGLVPIAGKIIGTAVTFLSCRIQ